MGDPSMAVPNGDQEDLETKKGQVVETYNGMLNVTLLLIRCCLDNICQTKYKQILMQIINKFIHRFQNAQHHY